MTTINKEEIQKFSNLADEWWDVSGKFKPLHMFNPIRIDYILSKTKKHFNESKSFSSIELKEFSLLFLVRFLSNNNLLMKKKRRLK